MLFEPGCASCGGGEAAGGDGDVEDVAAGVEDGGDELGVAGEAAGGGGGDGRRPICRINTRAFFDSACCVQGWRSVMRRGGYSDLSASHLADRVIAILTQQDSPNVRT